MVLSELIQNLNNSTVGKVAAAIIAVGAVGGVGFMIMTSAECGNNNNGYGPQVSTQTFIADSQKTLETLKANTTLPPATKKAAIEHLEGEIAQAQGKSAAPSQPGAPADIKK